MIIGVLWIGKGSFYFMFARRLGFDSSNSLKCCTTCSFGISNSSIILTSHAHASCSQKSINLFLDGPFMWPIRHSLKADLIISTSSVLALFDRPIKTNGTRLWSHIVKTEKILVNTSSWLKWFILDRCSK